MRAPSDLSGTGARGLTCALLFLLAAACVPARDSGQQQGTGSVAEPAAPPEIDREPNDRLDQRTPLGAGGRGALRPNDVDVYALDASDAPRIVHLDAQPATAVTLDVLGPSDPLGAPGPARQRLVAGPEALLVVVRAPDGGEANYQLDVEPLSMPALGALALEPNDRDRPLELPQGRFPARVAGFFDGPGDTDVVRVPGLRIDRPTTVEIAPLAGHRPILRVLTAEGELLASVSAERSGEGTGIPNLAPVQEGSALLFEITDGDGGTSERPWTLMLHRTDLGAVGELEPNDSDETARALLEAGGVVDVAGLFHRADDIDYYRLRLSQAGALTLSLAPDASTDAVLTWHEPGGAARPLDLAGTGEPETICAKLVEPGSHLVEVAARGLDRALARYRLSGRLETGAFEREPNDAPDAEGVVDVEGPVRGYLATPGDADVYRLNLIAPIDAQASQRITVVPPVGVDVAVEVIDEEGAPVVRPTDEAGRGQREAVRVPLGLFRYHLIVRSGARGGVSCDAPYEIRLD